VPAEGGWMIKRDTADATSASLQRAESEGAPVVPTEAALENHSTVD